MSELKRVVLIGDSIRMGYEAAVRRDLEGIAEVIAPEDNCGQTVNILNNIRRYAFTHNPDLVHINAGLHDLKTIPWGVPRGQRESLVPLPFYKHNVERIVRLLRTYTKAKILWATTTPVHDANSARCRAKTEDFDRYDEDVIAYNAAAAEVCRKMDVPLNDLYATVQALGLETVQDPDGVHFKPVGYEYLGREVAERVKRTL